MLLFFCFFLFLLLLLFVVVVFCCCFFIFFVHWVLETHSGTHEKNPSSVIQPRIL